MANDFNAALLKHRSNRISNRGGPQLVGIDDPIPGTTNNQNGESEPWIPLSTKALAVGMAGMYIYFKLFYEPEKREGKSWSDWIYKRISPSRRTKERIAFRKRREALKIREGYGPHGPKQEWGKPWR